MNDNLLEINKLTELLIFYHQENNHTLSGGKKGNRQKLPVKTDYILCNEPINSSHAH